MANPKKTSIATHPTQQTSLKLPSGIDRLFRLLVAAVKPENPGYFEVSTSQDVWPQVTAYSAKNFKTLAIEDLNQSSMPALHMKSPDNSVMSILGVWAIVGIQGETLHWEKAAFFRGFSLWTGSAADLQTENRPIVNPQLCDRRPPARKLLTKNSSQYGRQHTVFPISDTNGFQEDTLAACREI